MAKGIIVDVLPASLSWRTAIATGWLVAFRMFTRTLGVISTLILARILVPADFGLVAIATTFSAGVNALSQIGVQDALLRRPENDRDLFPTAFTLQALRGLITGSIIALAATTVARWFSEPRLVPVLLVLAGVAAVNGLENVGIVEFRRDLRYHYQFLLQVVPRVAGFCTTITMAFVLRNYWALFAGIAVSEIIRLITSYTLHPIKPKLTLVGWRKLVGFSFWLWLTSLACVVWDRCDPFILGPALGAAQLGVYLLAFEVATLPLTEFVQPAAEVLFAGFSAAHKDGTDTIALALSVAITLLLIVTPIAISISASAGYVVAAMLGSKWYEAQPLISILAFLCVFSPFPWVSSSALIARGLVRHNFLANLTASVMKVSVLTATVTLSGTMIHIAIAAVGVMGLEAVIFVGALAHAGFVGFGRIGGPLLRIMIAGATAILAADATGLAWKTVRMPSGQAVVWGGLLGSLVVLVFGVADFGCWTVAGKPAGPECRLVDFGKGVLRRYAARKRVGSFDG